MKMKKFIVIKLCDFCLQMCLGALSAVLKIQKRPHAQVNVNPLTQCDVNNKAVSPIRPGNSAQQDISTCISIIYDI